MLSPSHVEAIRKPQTMGQMLLFLGMVGYSRHWIVDFATKVAPLQAQIRAADQKKVYLAWATEAVAAFEMLRNIFVLLQLWLAQITVSPSSCTY